MRTHVYEICHPNDDEWDEFLAGIEGDVLTQTARWARTKESSWHQVTIGVRTGTDLVGGCTLLKKRIGPVRVAYAPRGPVLETEHAQASTQLVNATVEAATERWPSALIVQPVSLPPELSRALGEAGFTDFPIEIAPAATVQVPLDSGVEAAFAALRSSRRRNVRKAERAGVKVRRGGPEDLPAFADLHSQTAVRQGFSPMTADYLAEQWEELSHDGTVAVYLAELDGEALAAATVTAFGDRMVFKLAGLSESRLARDSRASDLLHWRIIVDAAERGFSYYDLGGFNREAAVVIEQGGEPPDEIRSSPSQFKLGFGGDVRSLPQAVWRLGPRPFRALQGPAAAVLERSGRLRSLVGRVRGE